AAVAGLELGDSLKVVREYRQAFWTARGYSGFSVTDLPFGIGWAATDSRVTLRGVMTQYIAGDPARAASRMSDDQRVAEFTRQFDTMYPDAKELATRRVAT